MKVVITGSRKWKNREKIRKVLEPFDRSTIFVHGAASGADSIADDLIRKMGFFDPIRYPVTREDWQKHIDCKCPEDAPYCYEAAKRRNTLMLENEKPDLVLVFKSTCSTTHGTDDCANKALDRKIRVQYFSDL